MKTTGEQYFDLAASAKTSRVAKNGLFACPCCDSSSFGETGGYEICHVCGWEDDPAQEAKPDLVFGANTVSLIQARGNYRSTGYFDPAKRRLKLKLPDMDC